MEAVQASFDHLIREITMGEARKELIDLSPEQLSQITYPHPTVSETLEDAVKDTFGPTLHNSTKA